MSCEQCDIAILGSGFAGSLLAVIAAKLGLEVVLLERSRHPRFAIGESSTPLANLKLEQLARRYNLDWLEPFAEYGSWKRHYPEVTCGLKRGFSFFSHRPGEEFRPSGTHETELLVAANPDAEHGDTHWYRSEFDAFFARRAVAGGVAFRDHCQVVGIEHERGWRLKTISEHGPLEVKASFVIDASGDGQQLGQAVGLRAAVDGVRTSSRTVYGHFTDVACWAEVLEELGADRRDHPFPCDAAALHHIIDGGWMWVLRFDNGVTSAGFSLDPQRHPMPEKGDPESEFGYWLSRYPSIGRQFQAARATRPIARTGRLQRRWPAAAGVDWAILPHGAAFVDPWLSPGIAHTLFGVERLAGIFADHWRSPGRNSHLVRYSEAVLREFDLIDRITAACFARFDSFPVMVTLTVPYFVAVTFAEERIRSGAGRSDDEFLLAHDPCFASLIHGITQAGYKVQPADAAAFAEFVARELKPFNLVGLCDPIRQNMYPFPT